MNRFYVFLFTLVLSLGFSCKNGNKEQEKNDLVISGWKLHDSVLAQINIPEFRDTVFSILSFGAIADTSMDSRPAINKAISECSRLGGGKVLIPPGAYKCNGPLLLLNDVQLVLDSAYVYFAANPAFYTPLVLTRWEGTVCYNYSPLIYAYKQKNISITGHGVFNGCEYAYWYKWNDPSVKWEERLQMPERQVIRQMGNDTVPVHQRVFGNGFLDLNNDGKDDGFGDGKPHYLRPCLFEPYECENVYVEGVTFTNSPFWTLHPVFCNHVVLRNLTVLKGSTNDDGIDPDGCSNVLIENCTINTHDDAISIKAGRDQDAWIREGAENIIIRNCQLRTTCNAFCIGSEMSGGVSNVWFYDSKVSKTGHAVNFKSNLDRGGRINNVFVKNISVDSAYLGIYFQMNYHGYRGNNFPTKFFDFYLENIEMNVVEKEAIKIIGVELEPIRSVWLNNILVKQAGTAIDTLFTEKLEMNNIRVTIKKGEGL